MTTHRAKSERGVLQLPSGRWQYRLRFKGKLHRKTFPSKGIAKAKREKLLTELREGIYLPPKAPTFEDAVTKFLKWSKTSLRPKTHTWDKWISGLWLASPAFAGKKLDKITAADIEQFKQEQRGRTRPAHKKDGEDAPPVQVSPRLVDASLARLRRLFSLAVTWGLLRENPAVKVPLLHEDKGRLRYLTAEEEKKLLETCSPRLALLVRFAVLTGMRRMEILKLCPAEVDLKAKVARVEGTRTKARVPRVVPLSKEALWILEQVPKPEDQGRPEIRGNSKKGEKLDKALMPYFGTRSGMPDDKLYRAFAEAVTKAEIHDLTFHDLRHTFASRLVAAGVNLITVQHLLGHASIAMTMRYAHLAPGQEAEAVERLSQGESIIKSIMAPFGAIGENR